MRDVEHSRGETDIQRSSTREVISLLSDLVAINSVNPSLVPGAPGEAEIAGYVADWLREAGLYVELQEAATDRSNVIGRVPGRSGGRSVLLYAHLDTVGVAGMIDPLQPRVEGDRLFGRGAYDMKAGLAAVMLAARAIAQGGEMAGDLIVAAVVDEEYASAGTQAAIGAFHADAVVVTEPTALRLCTAHKGFAWIAVETQGHAAHGSRPDLGIDAIAHMGRVLVDIESLDRELASRTRHPLLGTGSIHASLISGGQELSSYPEHCRVEVERRTVPGETSEAVMREVQQLLDVRARADKAFSARAETFLWRDPFEAPADAAITIAVRHAAAQVLGSAPPLYGETFWMDAALFSAAGIPTVVFGPGGAGAHATTEYALISEVDACVEILVRAALDYSATPGRERSTSSR